ncbi:hypothetical protein MW887_005866 [Aspergillus wentii]|nr:hypothetical protein MW887_005866 [Aspergillus wentii]
MTPMFRSPCCLVCGAVVVQGKWDYIFSEKLDWETQWEEQKHKGLLFCKASEVEDRYFTKKCKNQWTGLYRLIIYNEIEGIYQISGIAQSTTCRNDYFYVPSNKGVAALGSYKRKPEEKDGVVSVPVTKTHCDPSDVQAITGLPIHMHCWSFIKLVIGPSEEQNLECLALVLYARFRDLKFGTMQDQNHGHDGEDPLRIPLVAKTIHTSRQRRKKGIEKRTSKKVPSRLSYLPLEVLYTILDMLSCLDISPLFQVVDLAVPDRYWQSRAPRSLIFELDDIKTTEECDWEYLCLQMEYLIQDSSTATSGPLERLRLALRGRRRMISILQETKASFLKHLNVTDR